MELFVHTWGELLESLLVPFRPGLEQLGQCMCFSDAAISSSIAPFPGSEFQQLQPNTRR